LDKMEKRVGKIEQKRGDKEEQVKEDKIEEKIRRERLKRKEREVKEQETKEKDETKAEIRKLKNILEEKERKNNLAIKGLETEKAKETARNLLEKEFGIKDGVKEI